jgi:hypothetical protein
MEKRLTSQWSGRLRAPAPLIGALDITQEAAVSGLLLNLIAFVIGLFAYGSKAVEDVTEVKFLVTRFDGGVRVLKSDKYLQLAETAQVD